MDVRRLVPLMFCVLAFAWFVPVSAQGPDEKGAVLRTDFDLTPPAKRSPAPTGMPPSARPDSAMPDYVRSIIGNEAVPADPANPNARRGLGNLDVPDVNRDLQLTPAAGNWMIMVISYPGDKGPAMARKMCLELRNTYRAPAYVFVFGAEERRKEVERVRKIVEQQQQFFKEKGLTPFETPTIRHQFIELSHAVLIGGYADEAAAKSMLNRVKNEFVRPDPKKVDLELMQTSHKGGTEAAYVNPFKRAFLCRNPTLKAETHEQPKLDVAALRRINADESFSLFNCRKPYTLAVKEFQNQYGVIESDTSPNVWDKFVGANRNDVKDPARLNAHGLAEALTKSGLTPVFVLHGKFSSTVAIGEFNSPDDPSLKSMQETLATRFRSPVYAQIQFFYRPVPMAVPR